MKSLISKYSYILLVSLFFVSCSSTKEIADISAEEKAIFEQKKGDPVTIADEESEYEITIMDPGFDFWLSSMARPRKYYSKSFMANRNNLFVIEWNQRVMNPQRFNTNLYELQIDYQPTIDYGYEVNYKLYNYFIYFQRKYNQRLGPFVPRI